ncbi:ADP-ribose pyrophosphatase [Alteribacter lacisalsi]|jgi:ADP-ribose pyrophosphatase|uniref:ADP-ribose pyrophosphatase n=1 Tax=Alteribacter lacisalsi TaxID=2045244 RepID=A0A2W0HCB9_9BACI|nr:NUDIX hydrolase [Alteribacter lacisalsi]PYZ98511.1 ADP-ribose pyrophosphatase [Alteribacter lacisalsi]
MDRLEEKTTSKEIIYEGRIIDLSIHQVALPNGKESKREIINHPGAVAVLAVNKEGKLILVKQYRKALEKSIAEIPAGKLEKGEDPKACAARELEEETGYRAGSLEKVMSFYTSPGFADEIVHLYEAKDLSQGKAGTDEDEFVELLEATLDEAVSMIRDETIHDAKTICAIQHYRLTEK